MDNGVMCKLRGGSKIVKQLDKQIERQGKQINGTKIDIVRQTDRQEDSVYFFEGGQYSNEETQGGGGQGGGAK